MPDLNHLSAAELSKLIRSGEVTAVEAAKSCLEQISRLEPVLNSLLTVTSDTALAQAAKIDQSRNDGQDLPPLAGVPLVLKDNICTKDIRTTCGSKILPNFIPPLNGT